MIHTGKLLYAELYDDMTPPYTNVRAVWEARHSRHPGRCVVTNAHWYDPGPKQCGNYKVDGKVLSNQWPDALTGFGWNTGEPQWTNHMDNYNNFICTIPALINGERQKLDYGSGVERATTRTWFGRKADGEWAVEVTTTNYTLDGIVDRMEALGIVDGMVLDGSGSSQWYDGETHITGDGRTIYSYLLLWFEDSTGEDKPEEGDDNVNVRTGIDVSKWQDTIDWEKVKAAGIEFAMLRAGYGQGNIDEQFYRNADECTRLGIPFGVYWFSYAYNVDRARREAQYCIEAVRSYKLDYPIAFDFEYDSVNYAQKQGVTITKQLASEITRAFCEEIRAAGYTPILYANPDYLSRYFDDNVVSRYDIWLAQWPKRPNLDVPPENADIWQYSNSGSIKGISGRVDMNACYKDYIQEDDEMVTYEQIKPFIEQYIQDRRAKPGSSWSVNERNWAVGAGLYEGSDTGMMWQDSISREQSAAVAMRHYNYAMGETEKLIDKSVKELKDYVDEAVTKAINEAVQDAVNEALRE